MVKKEFLFEDQSDLVGFRSWEEERRIKLIRFMELCYLLISAFAVLYLLGAPFLGLITNEWFLKTVLSILLFSILCVNYLWLDATKQSQIWFVIIVIQYIFSILLILFFGTAQGLAYISIITVIYSSSVVYSWKIGRIFLVLFGFVVLCIYLFHKRGLNPLGIDYIDSNLANTVVLMFFLWLNSKIAKLGYQQIEVLYRVALLKAQGLENINESLDIELKKRTSKMEAIWKEQISAMQKSSAIGQITTELLHDLKNPMSSFAISLELLSNHLPEGFDLELSNLNDSYNYMVEIINNSSQLMKGEDSVAPFSLNTVIHEAKVLLKSKFSKNKIVLKDHLCDDVTINGNSTIMLRIVLNLLMNSIEAVSTIKNRKRIIQISLMKSKGVIELIIRDNGVGVSSHDAKKVFEEGYSLKTNSINYGLGLFFVKESLEKHFNSQIVLKSQEGAFCEFKILLSIV